MAIRQAHKRLHLGAFADDFLDGNASAGIPHEDGNGSHDHAFLLVQTLVHLQQQIPGDLVAIERAVQ